MTYLDSRSYFLDIITNVFLSSPFKGDFGAHYAHKDTNFILSLIYLVTSPTVKDLLMSFLSL